MSAELSFNLHFRPVGQGLFSHGDLSFHTKNPPCPPKFQWVYDCGAEKQDSLLQSQITAYQSLNPKEIDLLMLSHFDQDQVSGVRELLSKKTPKLIVAPYLSLTERLAALSALQSTDEDFARFLIAPAASLREWAGQDARIVFVLPGGGKLPDQTAGDDSSDNSAWPLWPNDPDPRSGGMNSSLLSHPDFDPDLQGARIYQINDQTPYVVGDRWEFAFYSRPRPDMQQSLRYLIKPAFDLFQNSTKESGDYALLIERLKMTLASGRELSQRRLEANEISLVVYSGPTNRNAAKSFCDSIPWITPAQGEPLWPLNPPSHRLPSLPRQGRCATLFTGNITLDDGTFADIERHFGKDRINFTSYFQVPHHGSRDSFRISSPVDLRPDYSIFSSDRYYGGNDRPNRQILEQLSRHGPLFVNEFQGLETGGFLE